MRNNSKEAEYKRIADENGLDYLGAAGLRFDKKYRFRVCGHEQNIRPSNIKTGEYWCKVCETGHANSTERWEAEASKASLEIISDSPKGAKFKRYKFIECGHEKDLRIVAVRNNKFSCEKCAPHYCVLYYKLKASLISHGCKVLEEGETTETVIRSLYRRNKKWPIRIDFFVSHPNFNQPVLVEVDGIQRFGLGAKSTNMEQLMRDCRLDLAAPEIFKSRSFVRLHQDTDVVLAAQRVLDAGHNETPIWENLLDAIQKAPIDPRKYHKEFYEMYAEAVTEAV